MSDEKAPDQQNGKSLEQRIEDLERQVDQLTRARTPMVSKPRVHRSLRRVW